MIDEQFQMDLYHLDSSLKSGSMSKQESLYDWLYLGLTLQISTTNLKNINTNYLL